MAAVDGKLYVTGGYDGSNRVKSGEVLELATMQGGAAAKLARLLNTDLQRMLTG